MTSTQSEEGSTSRSNLVAGAIVLVLLLAAAGAAVWLFSGGTARRQGPVRSVYFPGVSQLGVGTEVLFQDTHVGEVVRTAPPRVGLQLLVTSAVAPDLSQIITLFPGQRVRLVIPAETADLAIAPPAETDDIVIALSSLSQATIQRAGDAFPLRRVEPNRWLVDQRGSRTALTVNGVSLARRVPSTIRTGDVLAIGPVQVEWRDVSEYGRVDVHIDLKKLRKAAALPDSASPAFLLGPRSSLGMANLLSLGKPSLRLEPAFGREPFAFTDDSVIAPAPTLDLERSVQGMITYLNSPAALRRVPSTRFERVVSDLNDGLDRVAQLGERLDAILHQAEKVSRDQDGRGMIGRLVLTPSALESLDTTAARLAAGAVPFSDTSRSVLARLKLDTLESAVTRAVRSADRTLTRSDAVVGRIGSTVDSLSLIVSTVRDSLAPLLGRSGRLLDQGSGTAKGIQRWVAPVAISGIAVSVAGILKLIGVY